MSAADLAGLQARIEAGLRPLLAGRDVALLDIPSHSNCGDSAILLGEEILLRRLGARVVHRSDVWNFNLRVVSALPRDTVVCLHGGGNLGDLWTRFQALREHVLERLTDRVVVQLPQSIQYEDESAAAGMRALVAAHPAFHLFVRERRSVALAERLLGCEARLVPDMAFMLAPWPRPLAPDTRVVALCRTDRESTAPMAAAAGALGARATDWIHAGADIDDRRRHAYTRLVRQAHRFNRLPLASARAATTRVAYQGMARLRLDYGCRIVARGHGVVTDRLHAQIMCELMGIPNVAVDTGYGKLAGVHELWLAGSAVSRMAPTVAEAMALLD
jgi:exopolysaccharide biosynthesis predicted pyruvyltransferase EpsI